MNPIIRLADLDDRDFNPFMEEESLIGDVDDPYPLIHEMMRQGPVHEANYPDLFDTPHDPTHAQFKHFTVVGADAIAHVLAHPEIFSNEVFLNNFGITFGRSLTTMEPPEHSRYRRIFQKAFLPQNVSKWGETLVDPVVKDLLDPIVARRHGDLIQEFAIHYPFGVVFSMMNLPKEDVALFHKLAIAQTAYAANLENCIEAGQKLGAYIGQMVAARRAEPSDDIVSALALAEVDGERLPEEIVISFLRQLLNAGGDTTYRGTSVLLTALLTHPDQFAAVKSDRALIPQAIDEALRWNGPVLHSFRWAKQDTTLAGFEIPAGSVIDLMLGSANRDPRKFADPDSFNIFREQPIRHVSFASGPHICIGQHLARLEMKRATNAILDRMPKLRLDPDMPEPVIRGITLRVPKHLYIRCD